MCCNENTEIYKEPKRERESYKINTFVKIRRNKSASHKERIRLLIWEFNYHHSHQINPRRAIDAQQTKIPCLSLLIYMRKLIFFDGTNAGFYSIFAKITCAGKEEIWKVSD